MPMDGLDMLFASLDANAAELRKEYPTLFDIPDDEVQKQAKKVRALTDEMLVSFLVFYCCSCFGR